MFHLDKRHRKSIHLQPWPKLFLLLIKRVSTPRRGSGYQAVTCYPSKAHCSKSFLKLFILFLKCANAIIYMGLTQFNFSFSLFCLPSPHFSLLLASAEGAASPTILISVATPEPQASARGVCPQTTIPGTGSRWARISGPSLLSTVYPPAFYYRSTFLPLVSVVEVAGHWVSQGS